MAIVDDHEGFRARLRVMLTEWGYQVVAEAGDLAGAVSAVESSHPDMVLLDVQLSDGSGFDIVPQLRSGIPIPTVVMISSHEANVFADQLAVGQARGFISKADLSPATLLAVLSGP